jgi:class 3 adenylate cyclase
VTERSFTGADLADETWEAILDRVDPPDALQVGLTAYTRGNRRIATRAWSKVIDSADPDVAPQAAYYLGALLAEEKDWAGARAAYEQAAGSSHPDAAATAAVKLGELLAEQGDLAGARAAYEQAAGSSHPDAAVLAQSNLRILTEREGGDTLPPQGFVICEDCGQPAPDIVRYCPNCGSRLPERPFAPGATRKTITVLFVDVVDSTSLAERLDADSFRDVLRRFYEVTRRVIEEHGGTPEKLLGDTLLAGFGVPLLHEDDALRAVRAAVTLKSALTGLNDELEGTWGIRLAFRMGVNTGDALVHDQADTGSLMLGGEAVNIAARLEQAADAGEILIADATHQLVRENVVAERVGPVKLKGRDSAVVAWRLHSIRPRAERTARPGTPLVGRDVEMGLLRLAYQRVTRDGICHLITVLGEAGIGKTRLIQEFTDQLGDRAWTLVGRSPTFGEGADYYAPVAQMLRQAAQIRPDDTPALAMGKLTALTDDQPRYSDHLAWLLGLPGGSGDAGGAFRALCGVFKRMAVQRPLVLVIEDLQWAPPVLVKLVENLIESLTDIRLLLICIARPNYRDIYQGWGIDTPNAITLRLGPLTEEEAQELVSHLLRDVKPTKELLTRVWTGAAGNPLFVEALIAELREHAGLRLEDGNWTLVDDRLVESPTPPTIEALLAARLDRLDSLARMILVRAALIGVRFTEVEVTALVPESPATIAGTLERLVRAELLHQEAGEDRAQQRYAFRHMLIRDVAYRSMPRQLRAELHERYANWLERMTEDATIDRSEAIGHHLELAYESWSGIAPGDETTRQLGRRAGEVLAAAGRRAAMRGDVPAAAVRLLERAVELLPADHPQRLDTILDLADALQDDDPQKALVIYNRAVEAAEASGQQVTAMNAALGRLETRWLRGVDDPTSADLEEGGRTIKAARETFTRLGDNVCLARAQCLLAYRQALDGNSVHAARAAGEAAELARLGGDPRLEAEARGLHLSIRFWGPARLDEVSAECEQAVEWASERGMSNLERTALNLLARAAAMQGRFDEGRRYIHMAANLPERSTTPADSLTLGAVELLAGDLHAAERSLQQGYELAEQRGTAGAKFVAAAELARILLLLNREEEAEPLVHLAERSEHLARVAARQLRALLMARQGDLVVAESLAREAVAMAGRSDQPDPLARAWLDLAGILQQSGSITEARNAAQQGLELYRLRGNLVAVQGVEQELESLGSDES